jgi:hypothetical protein
VNEPRSDNGTGTDRDDGAADEGGQAEAFPLKEEWRATERAIEAEGYEKVSEKGEGYERTSKWIEPPIRKIIQTAYAEEIGRHVAKVIDEELASVIGTEGRQARQRNEPDHESGPEVSHHVGPHAGEASGQARQAGEGLEPEPIRGPTPEQAAEIARVLSGEQRWAVIRGDNRGILPTLPDRCVAHVITDPPYSRHVHASVRSSKRNAAPDVGEFECRTRRAVDLKFDHLSAPLRRFCASQFARLADRWVLAFSDVESAWLWRLSLTAAGMKYLRTGLWERIGGAPQFSGTEPASGCELITMCHREGRRAWNGGGDRAVYAHPVVQNRAGQRGSRVHTAQKPLSLMVELVEAFTSPDDLILDPFSGSHTTGHAALLTGRRYLGIEQDEYPTQRLADAEASQVLPGSQATRLRQQTLLR